MMSFEDFFELAASRKSERDFSPRKVPEQMIQNILDTAETSPYASGRRKNWEILVIHDTETIEQMAVITRKKSAQIASGLKADFRGGFESYSRNFSAFEGAPLLLVPVFRPVSTLAAMVDDSGNESLEGTIIKQQMADYENENHLKSISCVSMMVLLGAHAQGLGACIMTGPCLAQKELAEVLELKFGKQVGAVIPVGFPLEKENAALSLGENQRSHNEGES
jgi:nitroreductase